MNEEVFGARFILNTNDLQKGIKDAKSHIQLLNSTFNNSVSSMDDWKNSTVALNTKIMQLKSTLDTQEQMVYALQKAYDNLTEEEKNNINVGGKLLTQLNQAEAAYNKTKKQIETYEKRLEKVRTTQKELTETLDQNREVVDKATQKFKEATAGMIDWKQNADGLSAKIKQLNTIIPAQAKVVKDLEDKYEKLDRTSSTYKEEAQSIKDEWQKQNKVLSSLKSDIEKYSKSLSDLENEQNKGKISTEKFDNAMSDLSHSITNGAKKAIGGLVTTVAGYVTSLVAASESTREYRTDLSKLESNAKSAEVSLELTKEELKKLNAITGETDSNIEALSNLMMAGFKDNNLTSAVETLSNAVIKFPDTLKVESLADSLQESIKQMEMGNNATGQYAELLERLGYELETVTEQTNKKKTLEEKQAYLLDLVNKKIGGTVNSYREQNAELVNAADAQFELNDAMAQLGSKAEPSISMVKQEVAGLIKELINWADKNVDVEEVTEDLVDTTKYLGSSILPPLVKGLKTLLKHSDKILPVTISLGSAVLAYNAAVKTSNAATSIYNGLMALFKARTVASTAATVGQTVAQKGLNTAMKANPVGLVVAGLTLLTTAIVAVVKKIKEQNKVTYDGIKADKEKIKAIKEEKKAIKELENAKAEQIANSEAELGYLQTLKTELFGLIDTNGKVKKGYEARANFILNELNEALGTELTLNDLTKKSIDAISTSIDNLIIKQRAKIMLQAGEEAYTNAIQNQTKANNDLRIANDELMAAEAEKNRAILIWQGTVETGTKKEIEAAQKKVDAATLEYNNKKKVYDGLDSTVKSYNENIADYEYLSGLIQEGNTEKLQTELNKRASSYQENGKTVKLTIDEDIANELYGLQEKQKLYDKDVKNGATAENSKYKNQVESSKKRLQQLASELAAQTSTTEKLTPEVIKAWQGLATGSKDVFDEQMNKMSPEQKKRIMEQAGIVEKDGKYVVGNYKTMGEDSVSTIERQNASFQAASESNIESVESGIWTKIPGTVGIIGTLVSKMISGIKNAEDEDGDTPKDAGINFLKGVGDGIGDWFTQTTIYGKVWSFGKSLLKKLKDSLDEESPSKATREMGQFLLKGLGLGIEDEEDSIFKQVKSFGEDVLGSFNDEVNNSLGKVKSSLQTSLNVNGANASNSGSTQNVVNNFYQTNNSPKALSPLEVYRQTHNLLNMPKGGA